VPIFEVGEHEGQHDFSMGFVEGESLADRLKDGPLPPRDAAEYTRKVAEAIAFAHERGVIHRDLKPANVLLDRDDQPKVTDFGLAKRTEADSNLTGITRPTHIADFDTLSRQIQRPTFPLSTDHPVTAQRDDDVAAV